MMCDECGVRPANIHLTTFVNGEKQERNLCATCMTKYKKQLPNMDLGELAGLLGGFFEKALANRKSEEEDRFDAVCPHCGMTYAEFRRGGMLGCADCYRAFHKPLEELVTRVSGPAPQTGRAPGGVAGTVAVKMAIDRKKQKLMRAIAEEEYETAAALRDEIRALTAQLEAMNAEAEAGKEEASDE